VLRPDVDPAGRVEAEHRLDAAGDPAGDRHLLLVAARQASDLSSGPRVDLEPLDRSFHGPGLGTDVDQAPAAERGAERQRDVLADRALHEQGLGAVGGHVDQARPDRVRGMTEGGRRAVDEQLAAARTLRAG
jgi:hypothetical protein